MTTHKMDVAYEKEKKKKKERKKKGGPNIFNSYPLFLVLRQTLSLSIYLFLIPRAERYEYIYMRNLQKVMNQEELRRIQHVTYLARSRT